MTFNWVSLKADIADMLERAAKLNPGDDDVRIALRAIHGGFKSGRPKSDDDTAVAEVKLMAAADGIPIGTAARHVAKTLSAKSSAYTESTAKRLAEKARKSVEAENNLSAAGNITSVDSDSNVA